MNVQQSDEGDYVCKATNTDGNAEHIIQIDVQGTRRNVAYSLCHSLRMSELLTKTCLFVLSV